MIAKDILVGTRYPVILGVPSLKENAKIMYDELLLNFPDRDIIICGIGTSGAMIMTSLLLESLAQGNLFKPMLLAKDEESSHRSSFEFEHNFSSLHKPVIIIVDDIVASGKTLRTVQKLLVEHNVNHYVEAICASSCTTTSASRRREFIELFPALNLLIG